jgi:tripartite-type tricarboxylate transporter receptor subunit TctC
MMLKAFSASIFAASLLVAGGDALAQSYPVPNVTLVTHASPGGGSIARAMSKVATSPANGSIF